MFENNIEALKKKAEVLKKLICEITTQIQENTKKNDLVKELKKSRKDLEDSKKYLKIMPIACVLGTIIGCTIIGFYMGSAFISYLSFSLIGAGIMSGILNLWSVFNYFIHKRKYKKLATEENLEIEKNIDSILAENVELQENLAKSNVKLDNYKGLIEYLSEYNDKLALLNAINREDGIENSFNEEVNEEVDYSEVNSNNDLSKETITRQLSNKSGV